MALLSLILQKMYSVVLFQIHLKFPKEALVTCKSVITKSIRLNNDQDCIADVDGVALLLPSVGETTQASEMARQSHVHVWSWSSLQG